jgi:flagellar biosynthesis/type III secretory pathway protein FliH
VTSPWLPRAAEPSLAVAAALPAGPSPAELAAIYDEARDKGLDDGRAEGVADTAALRARLARTLDELEAARIALVAPSAEVIAEIAACVVETWIGNIYPGLSFAPIVRAWLAHAADQPATVRVHPDDAAALAEAIGEAPLTIATDASLARGALAVASGTSELVHDFAGRLADLRTAIVTALTGVDE